MLALCAARGMVARAGAAGHVAAARRRRRRPRATTLEIMLVDVRSGAGGVRAVRAQRHLGARPRARHRRHVRLGDLRLPRSRASFAASSRATRSYWMEGEGRQRDGRSAIAGWAARSRCSGSTSRRQQKRELRDFLRWNALEENKYYRYDYFLDNCSTRLRDALDRVLRGALRAATDSVRTPLSYRRESVRLTDGDRPIQTGIDIALGRPADAPLTAWESFFIPMRLRDAVRGLTVPNGVDGARVPLVASERTIEPYPGTPRVAELPTAPRLVWRLLVVGLVLAALVAGIRVMAVSRRGAVWGLARGDGGVVAAVRPDRRHPRARVDGDAAHLLGVERESAAALAALAAAGGAAADDAAARARRACDAARWRSRWSSCRSSAWCWRCCPAGRRTARSSRCSCRCISRSPGRCSGRPSWRAARRAPSRILERPSRRAAAPVVASNTRAPMNVSSSAGSIVPSFASIAQDVERALARHGALVGPVGRGERVVDVGDGHHARLHGDLEPVDAVRVAAPVQLLVVRVGDLRDRRAARASRGSARGSGTCA